MKSKTVTIASGGTTSAELDYSDLEAAGYAPIRVDMPAALDTANFTFQIDDGGGYGTLRDEGVTYQLASVAAGARISLTPRLFLATRKLKIVSSVTQSADRVMTVIFAPVAPRLGGGRVG